MEKDNDMLMDEELLNENRVIIEEEDYEANQVFMTPGQMIFRRFIRNRLAVRSEVRMSENCFLLDGHNRKENAE